MSDASDRLRPPLTRKEQKELLVLACRADRLEWRHACRPLPQGPWQQAANVLRMLEPLRPLLPGKLGGLMRGASFIASLGRKLSRFGA